VPETFESLSVYVPDVIRDVLREAYDDCTIQIVLNVDSTVGTYYLDNVRFE
jgi:hypothetical protein